MFKFKNDIDEINWYNDLVPVSSLEAEGPAAGIRGHSERLRTLKPTKSNKCSLRFNYLINRILSHCNSQPEYVIKVLSVNTFKNRLDELGEIKTLTYYLVTAKTLLKYAGSQQSKS